ncbi:MAG: DNA polymerase I [Desulfuromonas thiophila]|nr:DNA polymerase I [Desulfuromonas thiophila]
MADRVDHLYLIDGSSYIYRAYYAIRHLSTSRGLPCNAVLGFTKMLLKVLREQQPAYLAVVFDARGPTFRTELYPAYKANRAAMPEDLVPQIPLIKQMVRALNLPQIEQQGFEADDLIATLTRRQLVLGGAVTIVSSDKDLMQLVGPQVRMLDTMKDRVIGPAEVAERFGGAERVVEVQALAGDSSDNVPGVPGIGEKTARELIDRFGTLEQLLARCDEVSGVKRRENLRNYADQARLSRQLVTLVDTVPLADLPADLWPGEPDRPALAALLRELEFQQLYEDFGLALSSPAAAAGDYRCVTDAVELKALVAQLRAAGGFALDTETTSLVPRQAELVGLSFAVAAGQAWYVPVGHCGADAAVQLPRAQVLAALRPLLEDDRLNKVGQNLKYDVQVLRGAGIELRGIQADTLLQSYLLFPAARSHGLDALALEHCDHQMIRYEEVVGSGKAQKPFAAVSLDEASRYAAEDADFTWRLYQKFDPLLQAELRRLFEQVEMPLLHELIDMEWHGMAIDCDHLAALSAEFQQQIDALQQQIHQLAGTAFNLNSPKQLGEVLFETLALPHGKKTKTGWSTAVDVLTGLADAHPIVALILEYRSLAKLKGTYSDSLPRLVDPASGRIHSSFNQAVTATGRLSSSEPNLQNIPIRSEAGRRIRQAFIAPPGHLLLAADYSQIELRVMAHLADEPHLQHSFATDEDIHRRTASELFGVFPELVSDEQRRRAKTINFGVLYGMGAFSLARELGIPTGEAKRYIDSYFARYPAVLRFIEQQKQLAAAQGYVTTLLGRRCAVADIHSKNGQVRSQAERNAVNYPVQGSAADIIKVAMVGVGRVLRQQGLKSRMVLQVHDELLFEVPLAEREAVEALVRQQMEQAVALRVPLRVDLGWGRNWSEAH